VVASNWNANGTAAGFNVIAAIDDGSLQAQLDSGAGFNLSPAQVPEPASIALLTAGSVALLMRRRNRK